MLMSFSLLIVHYTYPPEGSGWMEGSMAMGKSEDTNRLFVCGAVK